MGVRELLVRIWVGIQLVREVALTLCFAAMANSLLKTLAKILSFIYNNQQQFCMCACVYVCMYVNKKVEKTRYLKTLEL